jgi:apolipoprotein N-acyltransferase
MAEPELRSTRLLRLSFAVLSGAMLGFSFPPFDLGILACFGLVPLLVVLQGVRSTKRALWYVYVAMLVFHAISINWTGGFVHANDPYMMIAGSLTILVHPLFYFIPMGIFLLIRRQFKEHLALIILPILWVGYEFSHSLTEWSFPWLTLGNSQTYDLSRIQFIEYTGVWGLSLWVLVINILAYHLCLRLRYGMAGIRSLATQLLGFSILLVYIAPSIHGLVVLSGADTPEPGSPTPHPVTVGIIQSNVDPWDKWKANGFETYSLYMQLTESLLDSAGVSRPDIVLWPETAFPFDVLGVQNKELLASLHDRLGVWRISLLTGLPHKIVYHDSTTAPGSARRDKKTGERYDWYNAAGYIDPLKPDPQWYGKKKMVPFAERIPYANVFSFVDFLRWEVGIGGWQIGPEMTIFSDARTDTRFSTIICYESTYPGFVADFVRRGAQFISLITIDSWWGKMSGAFQHQQISVLRAVENRRWIARCAVGGISCYIDPYGRAHDKTEMFTQRALSKTIEKRDALTWYTAHGDLLGEIMLWLTGAFAAAGFGQAFLKRKRKLG